MRNRLIVNKNLIIRKAKDLYRRIIQRLIRTTRVYLREDLLRRRITILRD